MKRLNLILAAALAVVLCLPFGIAGAAPLDSALNAAAGNNNLSHFTTAMDLAQLNEYIKLTGPVTIFAPVDSAFSTLENQFPVDNLVGARRVLLNFVVPGKLSLSDLQGMTSITNVVGEKLSVFAQGGNIKVGDAHIAGQPIQADNGVIYPVDGLITPAEIRTGRLDVASIMSKVPSDQRFDMFVSALDATSMSTALGDRPLTIFAPVDSAMLQMPGMTVGELERYPSLLSDMLAYGMAHGKLTPADLGQLNSVGSLAGTDLAITHQNGKTFVNGAQVIGNPIDVGDAVIYTVDHVMFPTPNVSNMPS
jgi:uncharacterized surface protein with fasciclin (FAS1) repeats